MAPHLPAAQAPEHEDDVCPAVPYLPAAHQVQLHELHAPSQLYSGLQPLSQPSSQLWSQLPPKKSQLESQLESQLWSYGDWQLGGLEPVTPNDVNPAPKRHAPKVLCQLHTPPPNPWSQ